MNRPHWAGPYLVSPRHFRKPEAGMQSARVSVPQKIVDCSEFGCEWYMEGREGVDAAFPFVHPQGVACGDFKGCAPCESPIVEGGSKRLCGACLPCKAGTSNCPCADRLPHRLPTEQHPLVHAYATQQGRRQVDGSEFKDRVAEGLEARQHILTRGL